MTVFGVDVASYQGQPNWSAVYGAGIRFGFSKVTENVGYVNPYWAHNRKGMLALGDRFLPGAYHFLHGGNGASQAKHFLDAAGDVSEFAVALDVEANGADAASAKAWVTEFKKRTGGHPVIGYFPAWYWSAHGKPDLSFFDTLWQSRYVNGTGSASSLFGHVPSSWWASFGGEPVSILQFSSSATVSGIAGHVDVNAYRGSLDQLRALALGIQEDDMPTPKELWEWDGIPAPPWKAAEGNKNWEPGTYLHWLYRNQAKQTELLAKIAAGDQDVDAIVAGVVSALDPDKVAALVADNLPADLAKQVADNLVSRLES